MRENFHKPLHKFAARFLLVTGTIGLALVPTAASAHDNLGGDELATANWMLVGAMVTIVIGVAWGIWASKTGQFTNIEESKYVMLENAEDYDAIMAEYDAQQQAARELAAGSKASSALVDPSLPRPAGSSTTVKI
jgi:hypothetical protein